MSERLADHPPRGIAVLDAGYTSTKLMLFDATLSLIAEARTAAVHREGLPYRSLDPEPALAFAARELPALDRRCPVDVVVPCAHGSALAALDEHGSSALPVMDYAAEPPPSIGAAYAALAPPFEEVFAPVNPGGLTLARQLYWQESDPEQDFSRVRTVLPWGQYFAYRLCGVAVSEVSALGAQTHLWDVRANRFSSLARARGWDALFAPLAPAWQALGGLLPRFRGQRWRGRGVVLAGVHDSNANLLRYLAARETRFTLLSSGTWIIGFDSGAALDGLDPRLDVVSNTTVYGRPVASCRFMGGAEYAAVAGDREPADTGATLRRIAALLDADVFALPSFTDSGGPMPGSGGRGRIVGQVPDPDGQVALASLYCALMTGESLAAIDSAGDLIVDGPFARNGPYLACLAALRPEQTVHAARAGEGTAVGAALLALAGADGELPRLPVETAPVAPAVLPGLRDYREKWRALARSPAAT